MLLEKFFKNSCNSCIASVQTCSRAERLQLPDATELSASANSSVRHKMTDSLLYVFQQLTTLWKNYFLSDCSAHNAVSKPFVVIWRQWSAAEGKSFLGTQLLGDTWRTARNTFDMFILNFKLTINLKTTKREAFYLVLALVKWSLRHNENLFPESCVNHFLLYARSKSQKFTVARQATWPETCADRSWLVNYRLIRWWVNYLAMLGPAHKKLLTQIII